MLRAREVFSSKYQGARCKPKLGCLGQVSLLSHHHVISFHEGQSVVVRNYIVVKNTIDRLPHSEIQIDFVRRELTPPAPRDVFIRITLR